jgi:nucleoside-diphosphate kinase
MSLEQTLSIVKPDAVQKNVIGKILDRFETAGLRVIACKMLQLTKKQAEDFYAIHRQRPFFAELVEYMISGPIVAHILEGDDAIRRNREIMGKTNPTEAAPGTIRADFAESLQVNAVHGSDGPDTASNEIAFFFRDEDICQRSN